MTLRTKTTLYFCAGFICIWAFISLLFFVRFKKALLTGFDDALRAKAALIASKTSLQPRIVPLPENNDLFILTYHTTNRTDTLYRPSTIPFSIPAGTDYSFAENNWRIVQLQQSVENGGTLNIIYAAPAFTIYGQIRKLTIFLCLVLLAGAVLSGIIAWYFSSRLLRPVRQVIQQANAINLNQSTAPLPVPGGEAEGQELVASINRMLARIQEQSERQTAFFAAASHELRTPLSVMQIRLQVLLQNVQENETLTEAYSSQLEEVQRLSKMVNDFLLMSQLQSGRFEVKMVSIDLVEILSQLIENKLSKALLRQNHFRILFEPEEADFDIIADLEKMEIIFHNLLDNAVKYAAENTIIHITVQKINTQISIQIANTIREDIHPDPVDIKNAFYHSKPLHGEGFGLGLWIANQLAELQNIDLYCSISNEKTFTASVILNH